MLHGDFHQDAVPLALAVDHLLVKSHVAAV